MSLRAPQPLPQMLAADEVVPTMRRIITAREALEEEDANQGTEAVIDMYRYAAVADKNDCLNEECRKAVRDIMREFANVGHGKLSSDKFDILLDTRKEIDQLCQDFSRNLRDNTEGAWFTPTELEGVPMEEIISLSEGRKDKVFINFGNRADRLLVLRHAHSPATRKKLYLGNEQKLSENVALFNLAVLLRDQNARLLGFKSHAEFKSQERMATSTEWVDDMLNSMREQLLPIGQGAMEQLKATKRTHLVRNHQSGEDEILPWDFDYYMRSLEEDKKELAGRTWHEDVEAWSVWDERPAHTGQFIGYLFSGILYRNGKYKGNQNVNLQASYVKPDGGRVFPATILMCNFFSSGVTGCALLKHSEVVTLFHELGHGIHDLLSRTFHTRYHAWRAPAEFAEALSTMLENWCWNKSELKQMSCHYTKLGPDCFEKWKAQHPGMALHAENIPDELFDQLIGSRDLNKASRLLQQTADSVFDMIIHNPATREDILKLDGTELYNSIKEDFTLLRNPDPCTWGPAHCHFGHLISGYDAGYFSYLSAQIFAADLYETAFTISLRSQQAWDRYRQIVLEPGGSRDGLKMMEEFLGHSPTPDVLVRALGVG
ncbi:hypothetical protein LA080_005540 [Diaporthe eres]|nr:hypothetical protein LA080_005540 [Diaporthe eres]